MHFRVLSLLLAAESLALGTELFTWHSIDTPVLITDRFQLDVHQRLRTRHEAHYLDQVRGGSTFRWRLSPRLTTMYGFYAQPQQIRPGNWVAGRRVFAGVELPGTVRNGVAISTRLVAERHMSTGRPDYGRYRSSVRLVFGKGRVAPYVQNELLAVRNGFHSTRNSGGLRMRITQQLTVEAGYLYDNRRLAWGGNRQAIVTSVRWVPKSLLRH